MGISGQVVEISGQATKLYGNDEHNVGLKGLPKSSS